MLLDRRATLGLDVRIPVEAVANQHICSVVIAAFEYAPRLDRLGRRFSLPGRGLARDARGLLEHIPSLFLKIDYK